jgi:hypothetical protein
MTVRVVVGEEWKRQLQQQIPFGDDNSNGKMRGSFPFGYAQGQDDGGLY